MTSNPAYDNSRERENVKRNMGVLFLFLFFSVFVNARRGENFKKNIYVPFSSLDSYKRVMTPKPAYNNSKERYKLSWGLNKEYN